MDNRLVIAGVVSGPTETRRTPAGIPIVRFTLRHQSIQSEAGLRRQAACSIKVSASGEELFKDASRLREGVLARIAGFLSRADSRSEECRLVLHAHTVEILDSA